MKKTLFIIGAFLLAQVLAGVVIAVGFIMTVTSQGEAAAENYQPGSTEMLTALMISDIAIIVATILICRKGWAEPFRWKMPAGKGVFTIVLSLIGAAGLIILTEALAEKLNLPDLMADTFQAVSLSPLALWAIALIGPLAEEVACRYGIAGSLLEQKKWAPWAVILVSAIIFAVLHMNPAQMLVAFIIGVYLGWLYIVTGSLWPCIICHVANNAVSVMIMREFPDATPDEQTLTALIGNGSSYTALLCGSAVILVLVIIALCKATRTSR